jgi:uncharacterized membrane protein YeaQ/YmgE (transglycosylase-associated protein family)
MDMLLFIALPVGITFGLAAWAFMRGRGRASGFALHAVLGIVGAFVGGLAGQAIGGSSGAAVAIGTVAGALLVTIVASVGFGPGPKQVASVGHRAGVAVEQPDHGEPAKTVR